ncbi:hypothetical protein JVT61DRAFT_7063 [Boletus reticuloceps]|uniref:Uncharacterized protein n=1 Tax=Boletus reticuloceps TaxID=495285 RepID=A0A8I3A819_9AGAM|nr:hypothetical protein JVT61DRAFT_7063 [Boletus reticuloceps]
MRRPRPSGYQKLCKINLSLRIVNIQVAKLEAKLLRTYRLLINSDLKPHQGTARNGNGKEKPSMSERRVGGRKRRLNAQVKPQKFSGIRHDSESLSPYDKENGATIAASVCQRSPSQWRYSQPPPMNSQSQGEFFTFEVDSLEGVQPPHAPSDWGLYHRPEALYSNAVSTQDSQPLQTLLNFDKCSILSLMRAPPAFCLAQPGK